MSISILLPFRNAAPWIKETVDSIQNQTYEDWELIAVDDFSTDESLEIVRGLAERDTRIRIHVNVNEGIIPALQLGLAYAKGEFLTRMDADDLMPENRLQLMIDKMESLPDRSIVTGKVKYFSDTSVSDGYLSYEDWLNDRVLKGDYFDHIYRECVVASPNWLARTDEIREYNIFSELRYPEDYDMTFRWMMHDFTIYGIDETTLLWREHPGRTSRNSEIYDQTSFFQLKLNWFCELEKSESIAVLGAGTKGKIAAEFFVNRQLYFDWYDLNWQDYGAPIYGNTIQNYELLKSETDGKTGVKLLIAIYPKKKKPLLDFLTEKGFEIGKNAWFL